MADEACARTRIRPRAPGRRADQPWRDRAGLEPRPGTGTIVRGEFREATRGCAAIGTTRAAAASLASGGGVACIDTRVEQSGSQLQSNVLNC